jgi:protein required for attachment to host cells
MQTTWVIAADAGRARIFEMSEGGKQLQQIEDLLNPDTLLDERSLGRIERLSGNPGSVGPAQRDTEQFSKRVGEFVEQGRAARRFDRLCLIAPTKFLDLMRQHLGDEARKMVEEEIPKDLVWSQSRDIVDYIRQRQH